MTRLRWAFFLLICLLGLNACGAGTHYEDNLLDQSPAASLPVTRTAASSVNTAVQTPTSPRPTLTPTQTRTLTPTKTSKPSLTPSLTATANQKTSQEQSGCLQDGGSFVHGSVTTKILRTPLVYRIYLPPCYHQDLQRRYPVLYLFHGQGFKDDQWDRIGADEAADRLIAQGEIPPFLIVMPYERYGGQPTESKFAEALTDLLVPHIDRVYRTIPDREHRAVGGLSRGGGWAIHFGMVYWQIFGAMGAHSAAVFHTDAQYMRTFLDAIPPDSLPRIYIDIGERDRPEILRAAIWYEGLLDEKDIPHDWHLFSGYHNEDYWTSHMEQYLRWYARNW